VASVTCELRDDVAVVTVDDGKANAYSHELIDELLGALDAAESLRAPVSSLGARAGSRPASTWPP